MPNGQFSHGFPRTDAYSTCDVPKSNPYATSKSNRRALATVMRLYTCKRKPLYKSDNWELRNNDWNVGSEFVRFAPQT